METFRMHVITIDIGTAEGLLIRITDNGKGIDTSKYAQRWKWA